ncbi:putative transposable element [Trichonephila clavipes]|nr:putative transposable element [Trichonephila clavipes]
MSELLLNGWTDLDDILSVGSSGFENDLGLQLGPISQLIKNAPKLRKDPDDSFRLTYPLKCLQFPVRLAFAVTIYKSQGQTMTSCGLDLENPCFSHGQLYVACPSNEAHFWLNGYVNKQNCRIWSETNPQVYVETPLHPEKLIVWCALWAGGILLQKR